MKIINESNLNAILNHAPSKGMMTLVPVSQDGTEKIETIQTHFLGEIAKIRTVEGKGKEPHFWTIFHTLSDFQTSIYEYSIEISVWKTVALIVLSPIFFIQYTFFGAVNGPLTRNYKWMNVKIEASRDAAGKIEMKLTELPVIREAQKTA